MNKLNEKGMEVLIGGISKRIREIKENYEWNRLFVNTGDFLVNNLDTSEAFKEDLSIIFSNDNLKRLSKKLKDGSGYSFMQDLKNELYSLFIHYEVSSVQAKTYITFFSQMIIKYLEENDPDKMLATYLGDWRKEETEMLAKQHELMQLMSKKLDHINERDISYLTIDDLDAQIRKKALYKGLSLDFFEIDDEQFEMNFQDRINKNRVFVVGKSREETLYRILNELKNKNSDRIVIIIPSQEAWEQLENNNVKDCILIPIFYAEEIPTIANNTNIFIYGEDEPCYSQEKIVLRKRTKKNLINSLENAGCEYSEAYRIVEKTHGLYSALKKKLFSDAIHNEPEWVKQRSEVVMAALLCGKWTETEGDKLVFDELTGKKYDDCKQKLLTYSHGETPYVIQTEGFHGNSMQIASIEDAWEELDLYISKEMWEKFIKLFYEVLIDSEPIFEYPFEKHFEASIYAQKPEWSQTLKKGMIRTLVMRAYYRQHDENQRQVDTVVSKVLETITTKERWGYISQYFTELCEASPKAVLEKIEKEFSEPTGMLELFSVNDGDFMTSRNYYTHILWAVEQLLQQKQYVNRAVEWLWKMNDYNIKYNISNSPKSVLEVIYCAWLNVSMLSVENKIISARKAVTTYDSAWNVIYSKLPEWNNAICSSLSTPQYRSIDEPEELYMNDVNKTYVEYLDICVENIKGNVDKWEKIIKGLHWYAIEKQENVLSKLVEDCHNFSDLEKLQIKNELRYLIYRHRYFSDADWSMAEEVIQKYEKDLKNIKFDDDTYDFLYLFSAGYDFPLLNPVPYHKEKKQTSAREENELLREKEIKEQIRIFKDRQYSLQTLIELAVKDNKCILGEVLAEYYCKDTFNEDVFELLLEKDSNGRQVYDYVRILYRSGNVDMNAIISKIKNKTNNRVLIANIISLEKIVDHNNAIIAGENDEIKREYWKRNLMLIISEKADEEVWIWALDECRKYGDLSSYLELLFDAKEKISAITLYEKIFGIQEFQGKTRNVSDYYLTETLKIVQDEFGNDLEKCNEIALLEWKCRNVLHWEQMKCLQKVMKTEPDLYAMLAKIVYKSDSGEEVTEEKKKMANDVYVGFDKARFCPAEKDGQVRYEDIKDWVDKFKLLLKQQDQESLFEHLVGRLLAFSPIGDDGCVPCEAVRRVIEENFNDSLKSSYLIAEENKRGVHTVDGGKSEMLLSENYKTNADKLCDKYPRTAEIYYALSDSYKWQADMERRRAEDEF